MAPFGLKLWGNAFQMIPDISFFDVEKRKLTKLFDKKIRWKEACAGGGGEGKSEGWGVQKNSPIFFCSTSKNEMLGIV